jgi:hypothetical protein
MLQTYTEISDPKDLRNNQVNRPDKAFHDWYRFVLSFPPHLVRHYITEFGLCSQSIVLDPFCGTGTTIVEAKKNKIGAIGVEATPMSYLASRVKTCWDLEIDQLYETIDLVAAKATKQYSCENSVRTLSSERVSLLLANSISEAPLHKCLVLREIIEQETKPDIKNFLLLAFAHTAVHRASNLRFGPEVGVSRRKKADAEVFEDWHKKALAMVEDLISIQGEHYPPTDCYQADARYLDTILTSTSIDAIITSPPYPNEKDYTRTTRLESVLLGFLHTKADLRSLKEGLLRSNSRNVYKADQDDQLIASNRQVMRLAREIERRRIALNKTSGFEKQYHRVTKLYFGGMKRHLANLQPALKPGAKLAYVVGDQASFLQVLIRTGEVLAEIAVELGYEVKSIDLFRTRIATATREQLREEVVVLEWLGSKKERVGLSPMPSPENSPKNNRYDKLIEKVFLDHYQANSNEVYFDRDEFELAAKELKIKLPKNLGDIIYSYRYWNPLPETITKFLEPGAEWIIRSVGRGKYVFAKSTIHRIEPNPRLSKIKILDATPEVIKRYALNDEQALLAILRYNRLIDIFTGVTCYSLQSHLRTTVKGIGQVETDEIYIGMSKRGEHHVLPIQAKGKSDQIGIVQIEQDFALCKAKFPALICRPIAAQFIEENLIALFEFETIDDEVSIREEKHYKIVVNTELQESEIIEYGRLS